jgi:hypothetical protein
MPAALHPWPPPAGGRNLAEGKERDASPFTTWNLVRVKDLLREGGMENPRIPVGMKEMLKSKGKVFCCLRPETVPR